MTKRNGRVHPSGRRGTRFGPGLMGLTMLVVAIAGLMLASVAWAAGAPVVTHMSASSGSTAGGNTVTVTGKDFKSGGMSMVRKVLFGAKVATHLRVVSATKLTVKAPSHPTGTVQVRVVSKAGVMSAKVKAGAYTYLMPLPTITALDPAAGPFTGGTAVTITGTHLAKAVAVTFGVLPATVTADSATQITVTSPAYPDIFNTSTTIFVTVRTAAGKCPPTMTNQFTYKTASTSSAPTVTSVVDNATGTSSGVATDTVTITGTGFTGATAVVFDSTPATSYTVVSATQITAVVPAGSGDVDVLVTNASGTQSSQNPPADEFDYSS